MSIYSTPIPGLGGYAGAAELANKAFNNAMARYQQQRSDTLLKYGYKQGADGSLGVDANNEFGNYQQMLRGESGQTHGLERAQAASGWGAGSGFLGAQQEALQHAQGGEQAALGSNLSGELSNLNQGEQDAAFNRDAALYQAEETAAQNAINQGAFNPANPPTTEDPADPYAAKPPTPPAPPGKTAKPIKKGAIAKRNLIRRVTQNRHAVPIRGRRR